MKMTSRLAALAIALLLTAGIAPSIALAAGGTGLSTGKAALTTQTAVTVPSSGITAASSFYLGTGQKAKFTAVAGKTYMGSVSSSFSWSASYYGIFTVLKGGKKLARKRDRAHFRTSSPDVEDAVHQFLPGNLAGEIV